VTLGLSDTQATFQEVTTGCCKEVAFVDAPSWVYGDLSEYAGLQTSLYTFTYELSASPADTVTIVPVLIDAEGNQVNSTVVEVLPAATTFIAGGTTAGSFILSASPLLEAVYQIVLTPGGGNGANFANVSTTTSVINTATIKPTPTLLSAIFTETGGSMVLTFDSATNRAGITTTTFPCTDLLSFIGADSTTCSWTSPATILGVFQASLTISYVGVGDEVTLLAGLIEPSCNVGDDCQFFQTANQQTVPLQAPPVAREPVVILRIPTVSASCDDVILDPTLSYGSGGRRWTVVQYSVTKTTNAGTEDATDIVAYLESFGTTTAQQLPISQDFLSSATYTITLTAENFLGKTGFDSVSFSLDDNPNLPLMNILGAQVISKNPDAELELFTTTTLATCSEEESSLSFQWTVYLDGVVQDIQTTSTDPTKFRASAYTFAPNSVYTIEMAATSSATANFDAITAVDSVTLNVGSGVIVAQVNGGTNRQLSTQDPVTIDASPSYDENFAPGSVDEVLAFQWTCTYLSTSQGNFGQSCNNLLNGSYVASETVINGTAIRTYALTLTNESSITMDSTLFDPLETYGLTATVSAPDGRFGVVTVSIVNTGGDTFTSITSLVTKVNPTERLQLTGVCSASYALDASWAAYDSFGIPIVFTAGTPLTNSFTVAQAQNSVNYGLLVPANSFAPGSTVTFRLTAHYEGNSTLFEAFSEVAVEMNSPPDSGFTAVSPSEGFALSTIFQLVTSEWWDDLADFPLTFEFTYRTYPAEAPLTLQSQSTINFVSTELPAGRSTLGDEVTLIVEIFDILEASTVTENPVVVTVDTSLDVALYVDTQIAASVSTGNANLATQAVSNAGQSLAAIDCSSVNSTYCTSLGRSDCLLTPQTCSSCLTGLTGIVGDSNTLCRNLTAILLANSDVVLSGTGGPCANDDECIIGSCVAGVCVAPQKTCPSDNALECSGEGVCEFVDTTGALLDEELGCTVEESDCVAQCACTNGYGGKTCNLNPEELESRDNTRATLCGAVTLVANTSDPSPGLLSTVINALYVSYDPNEVSTITTLQICQTALNTVNKLAAEGLITDDLTLVRLAQLTSKFVSPASDGDGGRRRLQSDNATLANNGTGNATVVSTAIVNNGSFINAELTRMIKSALLSMVNGQDPIEYADENLQVIVIKDLATNIRYLIPPLTEDQVSYGVNVFNFLEFTEQAQIALDGGNSYVNLAVTKWSTNPFPNSTALKTPLLRFEAFIPDGFVVLRKLEESRNLQESPIYADFFITVQFSLEQDFNFTYSIAEAKARMPPNYTIPECTFYNGEEYTFCKACNVTSYNNYNVTFGCPLELLLSESLPEGTVKFDEVQEVPLPPRSRRGLQSDQRQQQQRRLQTSYGQLQFASKVVPAVSDPLRQNPFSIDFEKMKGVISFLACLVVLFVTGYIYFRRWDIIDRGYLIYAKDETERRLLFQRHTALRQASQGHRLTDALVVTPQSKRSWTIALGLSLPSLSQDYQQVLAPPLPGQRAAASQAAEESTADEIASSSRAPGAVSDDEAAQECDPLNPFHKAAVATSDHFITGGFDYLRLLYVASDVNNSTSVWHTLYLPMLRFHEYSSAFFGPSMRRTRLVRWATAVTHVTLIIFFNTLFFQIIYPDDGFCNDQPTRDQCLIESNGYTANKRCQWQIDELGGYCSLNPPPPGVQYVVIVVMLCLLIVLPIFLMYEVLLFYVCTQRPDFAHWGYDPEKLLMHRPTQELSKDRQATTSNDDVALKLRTRTPSTTLTASQKADIHHHTSVHHHHNHRHHFHRQGVRDADTKQSIRGTPEHDFIARRVYDDYTSPEAEAELLLVDVSRILAMQPEASFDIPWQESSGAGLADTRDTVGGTSGTDDEAFLQFVGIRRDGSPEPMTIREMILFGTPKNRLANKIRRARESSHRIQETLTGKFYNTVFHSRDAALIQFFVVEQFSILKRYVIERHLLDFSASSPTSIHPGVWISAWAFVIISQIFFLMWSMFAWAAYDGGTASTTWAKVIGLALFVDIFFTKTIVVYILFVLSVSTIKPQLRTIYRVLNRIAMHRQMEISDDAGSAQKKEKEEEGEEVVDALDVDVDLAVDEVEAEESDHQEPSLRAVQHFSGACRAAKMPSLWHLPAAELLRALGDSDAELCKRDRSIAITTIGALIISIPMIIAFVSEMTGDVVLQAILPLGLAAFLLANWNLFLAISWFIVIPYFFIAVAYYYYNHQKFVYGRRLELVEKQRHADVSWQHASRTRGRSAVSIAFNRSCSGLIWCIQNPREAYQWAMFTSGKYLREPLDATYQTPLQRGIDEITQWKLFNYPHQLHGRVEKHLAARRRSSATRASEDIHISINASDLEPLVGGSGGAAPGGSAGRPGMLRPSMSMRRPSLSSSAPSPLARGTSMRRGVSTKNSSAVGGNRRVSKYADDSGEVPQKVLDMRPDGWIQMRNDLMRDEMNAGLNRDKKPGYLMRVLREELMGDAQAPEGVADHMYTATPEIITGTVDGTIQYNPNRSPGGGGEESALETPLSRALSIGQTSQISDMDNPMNYVGEMMGEDYNDADNPPYDIFARTPSAANDHIAPVVSPMRSNNRNNYSHGGGILSSSLQARNYRRRHTTTRSAAEAIEGMLWSYREYVEDGHMELRPQERMKLINSASFSPTSLDFQADAFDVTVLLEEALFRLSPVTGEPLSDEEKEEVSEAFVVWVSQKGAVSGDSTTSPAQAVASAMFGAQSTRSARNVRDDASIRQGTTVSWREFRQWFENAFNAIERYRQREQQMQHADL